MTTAVSKAEPTLGHNNPPEKTLPEQFAERFADRIAKVEPLAFLATALPKTLDSDHVAPAADIARDARDLKNEIEKDRKIAKEPFLRAGNDVDDYFKPILDRLDKISKVLLERITQFNRAVQAEENRKRTEAERVERERAEQAKRDAEAAAAVGRHDDAMEELKEAAVFETRAEQIASAPDPSPEFNSITDSGTAIGTRRTWTFEIVDFDTLDLNKLRPFIKREDVEKALRAHIRIHKGSVAIGGVRFFEDEQATVRR